MSRSDPRTQSGSGGARWAPPLLFVLAIAVFGEGGDWPPATFFVRVAIFALAGLFLLRRDVFTLRPTVPDILVGAWLLWEAASLPRAAYPWVSTQWFSHHAAAFVLYLLVRGFPGAGSDFPRAGGAVLVGASAVQLVIAVGQRYLVGTHRLTGTLQNPNFLAEFLLFGAVAAWLGSEKETGRADRVRIALRGAALVLAGGILLTGSRGGFLLLLAAAVCAAAGAFGWRKALAAAAVVALAAIVVPNPLRDRFAGAGDPYAFERLRMWEASLRIVRENPIGVGVGHFKYHWPSVREPVADTIIRYAREALTPHSEPFSVIAELGIPGALLLASLGTAIAVALARSFRAADRGTKGAAAIVALSALQSLVDANWHVPGLLLVVAAALAVVSGRLFRPVLAIELSIGRVVRPAALGLLLALAVHAAVTFAGFLFESRGAAALKGGRLDDAEAWFSRATAADPWRSTAPDALAAVRLRLHDAGRGGAHLDRAIAAETEAERRNPVEFRYPARLAFLHMRAWDRAEGGSAGEGNLAQALGACDRALKLNPHAAEVIYRKAALLLAAGRREEARREAEALVREEPRFARGWELLGALVGEEEPALALRAYREALAVHVRYRHLASDPEEKAFVDLDENAVIMRIRELGA